jgi:hypothetical protein
MEMKCIGKNISIWAKVSLVSDVAHGPLVCIGGITALEYPSKFLLF